MSELTEDRINHLIQNHNWELARADNGRYLLRQKDNRYMKTIPFDLPEDLANKYMGAELS